MSRGFSNFFKRFFLLFSFMFLVLLSNNLKANAAHDFFTKTDVSDISLNKKFGDVVRERGDDKWYRFTSNPGVDYWYELDYTTTGPALIIYDEDGAVVRKLTSMNWFRNTQIKLLSSKTYYAQIYTGSDADPGSFTLAINCNNDESDDKERATAINGEYSGELIISDDVDWLSFNSGSNTATTVTVKNIGATSNIRAQIFNEDGTKVTDPFSIGENESKSLTVLVKANTKYYIKVEASNLASCRYGRYKVSVSGRKDESGTRKKGQTFKAGKTVNGTIDASGDEDWYKIKLNKNRKWKFTFKNLSSGGQTFYLYKGKKLLKTLYVGSGSKGKLKCNLKKGTYYIKVDGEVGNYSIKVNK